MATYSTEHVLEVRHWSDKLFSFTTTRAAGLRFDNGQFLMLGLEAGTRRIVRAYSIASANYEEHLEFYSIKIPNGPLTSRLQHVAPGAPIFVSAKPTGTLVLRDLRPGKRLFLLATGTGVAPFLGIAADPEVYSAFEQVVLVRGARRAQDHAYGDDRLARLRSDPDLGEVVRERFRDYPCVSREPFPHRGRITDVLADGRMLRELGLAPWDPANDRFMICGNMRMLADLRTWLDARAFEISPQIGVSGDYVIERAFVEENELAATAAARA
jgi:ferredoxin--NADP+ reductase